MSKPKLCPDCGQPMLPRGVVKQPDYYDHANGCPRDPKLTDDGRARKLVERYLRHCGGEESGFTWQRQEERLAQLIAGALRQARSEGKHRGGGE